MKASPIPLLALLLAITTSTALADAGPSRPPPRPPGPPGLRPDSSPVAQVHVDTAQAAVKSALAALTRATTTSHGGYIEKAMVEANKAADDLTQIAAYLKAHPEANTLVSVLAPVETSPPKFIVAPDAVRTNARGANATAQTNMLTALDALNAALNEFSNSTSGKSLVIGDFGGLRKTLIDDLVQANTDVLGGINFANGTGPAATPAPASTTASAPKATADDSDNSQRLPSAIAGLALSAALSLGGLHVFSRKKSAKM